MKYHTKKAWLALSAPGKYWKAFVRKCEIAQVGRYFGEATNANQTSQARKIIAKLRQIEVFATQVKSWHLPAMMQVTLLSLEEGMRWFEDRLDQEVEGA